jgi:PAS domain S-box-containing protein
MAGNRNPSREELTEELTRLRQRVDQLEGAEVAQVTAENALRAAEQRFRVYVDNAPEAIFVANKSGLFVDVNPAACRMTGYRAQELCTMTMADLAPSEDQLPSGMQHLDSVRETGTGQGEYPVVRRDGRIVWLSMNAVLLETGRVLAFCRDATERREAEERVNRLQVLIDAVIAQSSIPMVVAGPDATLEIMNDSCRELLGVAHDPEWQPGLNLLNTPQTWQHLDEQNREIPIDELPISRALLGEASHNVEMKIRRQDGSERWTSVDGVPIRDFRGQVIASLVVFPDISDRKEAEEKRAHLEAQLQQSQKLESLGVLAGGIAHDFNNLLMGILGNAGLALMDLDIGSPVRESISGIEAAALRAKELTSQMLAYSGRGRFIIEVVELSEVIASMMNLLEVSISKNVVQRTDFSPQTPPVEADVTQLRQIIMNLVTNASEAIQNRSGTIRIATGALHCDREFLESTYLDDDLPEGAYSYLEVTDTGVGMSPSTVDRMFEPFFTTKFSGRGLGLAAVLGIVRGHSGAIKVLSVPNHGTTVQVLFPVADPAKLTRREPSSECQVVSGGGTVLLVDDEETVRLVGGQMLERLGYEVVTAADGREALEIFEEDPTRFACVILDQTMPHMGGKECLHNLRKITPDVRVILSSGYSEQELEDRYADEQLAGFIQKPYLPAALAKLLKVTLS